MNGKKAKTAIVRGTLEEMKPLGGMEVPQNTLICGENVYYSKDCYETQLNNNVMVVGTSGAGKTRGIVMPNLLQAEGSYVVSDPKGNLYRKMKSYLEKKGYNVLCMDFIHPEKSLRYNPITRCKTTNDVFRLAHMIVYELNAHNGAGINNDPFWDEATVILFSALIGYLLESNEFEEEDRNLTKLAELIKETGRDENGCCGKGKSLMDHRMERHKRVMDALGQESWAYSRFQEFNTAADRTHATITICSLAKMASFDTLELRKMLKENDLDFTELGKRPTALFVQVSDTDRSKDILVNLLYSQLLNELCSYADECCEDSRLPVPVQFILDDFATNARIDNFENIISNIRSRNISAMLMLQSETQLEAGYGLNAQTILDNCNTYIYMGGMNPKMAVTIAQRANKVPNTILNMPIGQSWIFRRGQEPLLANNFKLEWFMKQKMEQADQEIAEKEEA